MFRLSTKSEANLQGVEADLQAVVRLAIELTDVDFSVVEGVRDRQRQQEGKAVNIYPRVDGETSHETHPYNRVAKAMFKASQKLEVEVEWGGFWEQRDKPHWQII